MTTEITHFSQLHDIDDPVVCLFPVKCKPGSHHPQSDLEPLFAALDKRPTLRRAVMDALREDGVV